jgi:GMP synthase (glutamine-hydrolysing)
MAPRLLVVQHEPSSPPGLLAGAAAATAVELVVVEAPGEPVPVTLEGADGLVVLGGVMDADETDDYPHLARTKELLADAAARSAPALGICLGAQLAAAALGGRAYPGPAGEEIGWSKVELTDAGRADPVVGDLREPVELFEWHHDTFDPPPGAILLAGGAVYPSQAFRLGSVVAVQFHPEVDGPLLAGWWAGTTPAPNYPIDEVMAGASRNAANASRLLEAFCRVTAASDGTGAGYGTMPP